MRRERIAFLLENSPDVLAGVRDRSSGGGRGSYDDLVQPTALQLTLLDPQVARELPTGQNGVRDTAGIGRRATTPSHGGGES